MSSKEHLAFSGGLPYLEGPIILTEPHQGTLTVNMSKPESANTSRSASPSGAGDPKSRLVSASLKDRIAKFNNPSAAPLLPTHAFGTAGPGTGAGGPSKKGLYGNRIPGLDPKSAGHIPSSGSLRKVSESRGLIGNRIPSSVSGGSVAGLAASNTGSGGNPIPAPKSTVSAVGRPSSPTESMDSSTPSAPADSGSPGTSRSSSPPTSPGGGLPPSLLAATLPDYGGPGAMTPSSTRADAGEEQEDRSAPATPVVGASIQLPPAEYDLVPGNLKLATAAQMSRGLSATSAAPHTFAPSVTSSLASQYDPSSQGNEEEQMMQAVSGISTPTGTPKGQRRELEDSTRGEGSVRDEGSVMGDGEEAEQKKDMEGVNRKLEGLALEQGDDQEEESAVDEAGMVVDDQPTPSTDAPDPLAQVGSALDPAHTREVTPKHFETPAAPTPSKPTSGPQDDEDPNQADDLAALKRGDLSRSPPAAQPTVINPLLSLSGKEEAGSPSQQHKSSTWSAEGQTGPREHVNAERNKKIDEQEIELGPEMVVRPPTPGRDGSAGPGAGTGKWDENVPVLRQQHQSGVHDEPQIDIKPPRSPGEPASTHDFTPNIDNDGKNAFVQQAFQGDVAEPTEEEEDAKKEEIKYTGPGEVSGEEKVGMAQAQSAFAIESQSEKGPDEDGVEGGEKGALPDKREGKTYAGELEKVDETKSRKGGAGAGTDADTPAVAKVDEEKPHAEIGGPGESGSGSGSDLPPLHFSMVTGQSIEPEGKLEDLPTMERESKVAEKGDTVGVPIQTGEVIQVPRQLEEEGHVDKEESQRDEEKAESAANEGIDLMELPTSDGSTVQVPKKMDEADEDQVQEGAETIPETETKGSTDPAQLKTRSEEPILTSSPRQSDKPLHVLVEPAPIAQSVHESKPPPSSFKPPKSSSPSTDDAAVLPSAPVFPEPPHDDPSTSAPSLSARSTTTEPSDRSSTPLDPAIMRSFPDVPDEEHPRVEIHVSPHVTPAKSPLDRASVGPTGKGTGSVSDSPLKPKKGDGPQTPGKLDVESASYENEAKLSKRRSVRRSPKSPLLDDEDPGDYVPGDEGWAVVTKGRDE
ncbi:uncharacterized protein MKK02DRAFT_29367 [Dioszegia hungarica]|uniref:Uncharacterized protein n=1 Tax=Dioszegia hungarica TaxID=4972 RepID=A0AA38LWX6_9TREE|nr:uncharacterized protein MKK02DRAFT_29367 [Dioszegia hungarica]KAI9639267.1 hypothetical protein MKK02DRAFT_29367 [Dioszegia hungarica]